MKQELNCLSCRFSQLQPDTDFTKRGTVIYCAAPYTSHASLKAAGRTPSGEIGRRPVNYQGCRSAAPMPRQGSGVVWSEVAIAFLRSHWTRDELDSKQIGQLLRRSVRAVSIFAEKQHFKRHEKWLKLRGGLSGKKRKSIFNAAQKEYILACVADGTYPLKGGGPRSKRYETDNANRKKMLARVAELGFPFKWPSIRTIVMLSQPAYQRNK